MSIRNNRGAIQSLALLCCSMCFVFVAGGLFSYLLKGWLIWDLDKPFPFGWNEGFIIMKISLLGFPMGFVLWVFNVR